MNTPASHRLVAMALSLVVTLGLFQTIAVYGGPEHRHQVLVRADLDAEPRV